ncbi:tetratricopeptide repeat protein [Actinoplanes sp. NPDC049118]|uniref:tetratricopeptide repeat protein n=1 Tax=Actinoplanes sp. NPDC049118 TaxID=3155769 RepID=UPI0033E27B31
MTVDGPRPRTQSSGAGRAAGSAGAALLVAAGVMAALANFVAWPVAAGLGALSGAAGLYGGVQLQRRSERRAREAAWAAAVRDHPAGAATDGDGDGVLTLLLPERQTVPYSPLHHSMLRELTRWGEGRGRVAEPVVYVEGPPGYGKTRLLVEFAARPPVRCGWVADGRGTAAVAAAAGLGVPVVLLVDDADTRTDVSGLLTALAESGAATVRVVLAARPSAWWQTLRAALPKQALTGVPHQAQLVVPAIVGDARGQRQYFGQALRHFTAEGVAVPGAQVEPQEPPPSILLMHAAAALTAESRAGGVVRFGAVVDDLFALERARWRAGVGSAGLSAVPGAALHAALVLTALLGAADEPAAGRLLAGLPAFGGAAAAELRGRVADWLRSLYPQRFPDWLAPHLPAVLIEAHAARVVAADSVLAAALVAGAGGERAGRLVSVFGRAMTHSPHAGPALTALIGAEPYAMTAAAITATASHGFPADSVIAASVHTAGAGFTAEQLLELHRQVPDGAKIHLLAETTVALLRSYLDHESTDRQHPETLNTRHNLANVFRGQGRYEESAAEYRSILAARTEVLGAHHPDTLNTRHGLAEVLGRQGRYGDAVAEYRVVLAAQTDVQGADHPDAIRTRHNLAVMFDNQGRFDEAAAEYRVVLAAQTAMLGPDHPDTLYTRHNVTLVLESQGRYDEAIAEGRAVLAARTEVLGADHPETLGTRHGLAMVLGRQGRYDEAVAEYRAVLAAQTEVLGADHPDSLSARHGLAVVLVVQGRYDEAVAEYRVVLDGYAEVLPADHPHVLSARQGLANVLSRNGRYDEAAAEYRAVLAAETEVLGAEHPHTLNTRHGLAFVLDRQGHHEEAVAEYRAVLAGRTGTLGADHPDTVNSRRSLANALERRR